MGGRCRSRPWPGRNIVPSSDDELLNLAIAGDRKALTRLLEETGPIVRRKLGRIPPKWQSVLSMDDVMQETYHEAFTDIRRFIPQGMGSFIAWLTTIAKRNLLDCIRLLEAEKRGKGRKRVEPGGGDDSYVALCEVLSSPGKTPSSDAARKEGCRHLERAILELSPVHRQVVQMYDLDNHSAEEVAKTLGCSPGAVFMRRARAHRRMREIMGSTWHYLSSS